MKKYYCAILLLFALYTIGCSKKSSGDTQPPVNKSKLVKKEFVSFSSNSNSTNVDSFAYDVQQRMIYYSISVRDTKYSSFNWLQQYQFSYSGSSTVPESYIFTYTGDSIPSNTAFHYSITHKLEFDAQDRIVLDSSVSATLPSLNEFKIRHYYYSTNLYTSKTIYPNNTASNSTDSTFIDNNGNATIRSYGLLDANNKYTHTGATTTVFGSTLNPFHTSGVGTAFLILFGYNNKNLQSTDTYTNYSAPNYNPPAVVSTNNYQYITDTDGWVITATLSGTIGNIRGDYTYY
jgi:hypothetical protein